VDKDVTGTVGDGSDLTEEDRGLITGLTSATVIDMVNAGGVGGTGRKFSIGSDQDSGKTSFANKSMKQIGDEIVTNGLGYTCRKGLKPESPNQDSWMVLQVDDACTVYGVFDGHGQKGHDVSNFVKENMPKLLIKDPRFKTAEMNKLLFDTFKKTQNLVCTADRMNKINAKLSGTTASIAVQDTASGKVIIAHVADSTVVLGSWEDESKKECKGKVLTRDHKPDLPDEKARIEKSGGRVVFDGYANHRVYAKNARYPGLNMSRCLGDIMGHQDCGVSAEPEVTELQPKPLDHVLLLCSDGVWEFITADEAVKYVAAHEPAKAMFAAEQLAKEAWDRWIKEEGGAVVDDITVVLKYLQCGTPPEGNNS
jgi:serine/threonine protein phosphatase PrpC